MIKRKITLILLLLSTMFLCSCRTTTLSSNEERDLDPPSPIVIERETEYTPYMVYYNNVRFDPNMLDCSAVYPVERKFKNGLDYVEAIQTLIDGPSVDEIDLGYVSSIPAATVLFQVTVVDTTALIDFELLQISGSCAIMAARSQIEKTIKQFELIDEVVILVNGEIEGVLEP